MTQQATATLALSAQRKRDELSSRGALGTLPPEIARGAVRLSAVGSRRKPRSTGRPNCL